MDKKPFDHAFTYRDVPALAETFADGVHLVAVSGSTATIVLTVSRADAPKQGYKGPPKGEKVTAARLVLSNPAFVELYNQMHQMMAGLEQQGLIIREGQNVRTLQ